MCFFFLSFSAEQKARFENNVYSYLYVESVLGDSGSQGGAGCPYNPGHTHTHYRQFKDAKHTSLEEKRKPPKHRENIQY